MCQAPIGYSSPTTSLIGPCVTPMWFISKYLSYSALFTCCVILCRHMQRSWQIHHSAVACSFLLHILGQKGATPVTPVSTRPLHITFQHTCQPDWCNARGFPVHSAVASACFASFTFR